MHAAALLQGFALSFGLIAAVGPQNTHVLSTGLRREFVGMTVAICVGADVLLIVAGALGVGRWLQAAPGPGAALELVAAAFLLWHAGKALRALQRREVPDQSAGGTRQRRQATLAATLLVTFANPSVYLETLLLIGSSAAAHDPQARGAFAAGAIAASLLWFSALGWGARHAARWLRGGRSWQVVHGLSAVAMVALAVSLLWSSP